MCALLAWDLSGECTESVMLQIPLTVPNKFLGMAHSDGWCRRTAHKHPRPQVQTPSNTNFYKDSFFIWSSASLLTEETWGQFHLCGRLHGVCFLLFSFLNQNKTNLTSQQVADILDLYDPSPVLLPPPPAAELIFIMWGYIPAWLCALLHCCLLLIIALWQRAGILPAFVSASAWRVGPQKKKAQELFAQPASVFALQGVSELEGLTVCVHGWVGGWRGWENSDEDDGWRQA